MLLLGFCFMIIDNCSDKVLFNVVVLFLIIFIIEVLCFNLLIIIIESVSIDIVNVMISLIGIFNVLNI